LLDENAQSRREPSELARACLVQLGCGRGVLGFAGGAAGSDALLRCGKVSHLIADIKTEKARSGRCDIARIR